LYTPYEKILKMIQRDSDATFCASYTIIFYRMDGW
jgi:hypothetical protein